MSRAFLLALLCLGFAGCIENPGFMGILDAGGTPTYDGIQADAVPTDGAPVDGWASDAIPGDGQTGDAGGQPPCTAPFNRALRLFFIGNSFTLGGPIPTLVGNLAGSAGFPAPHVQYSAQGGFSLSQHRNLPASTNGVAAGNWDFVVLQEYSTKPTDNAGNPTEFKKDATWFYDKTKAASPGGRVILYETWARHPDHSIYPTTFTNPKQMQAQLRHHYNDAAKSYIPKNAQAPVKTHARVAPVGDAWEKHLAEPNPLRLHSSDNYHAGPNGQYLNALVIYSIIYGCRAKGLSSLGISSAAGARLQGAADKTTGIKGVPKGGSAGTFPVGSRIRIDLGPVKTTSPGWNNVTSANGTLSNAPTTTGAATSVDLVITDAFSGTNSSGRSDNKLGWPASVTRDTLWSGSFSGHTAALKETAEVQLKDLPGGSYKVEVFASRAGKDGTMDRLSRYTINSAWQDLDATDNLQNKASFNNVSVGSNGTLVLGVAVSPAGTGRYSYLGALIIERLK